MNTRTFSAVLSSLDQMMDFARDIIHSSGICPKEGKNFEVAVEEAIVNIIHYAYQAPSGIIEIGCKINEGDDFIIIELKDRGTPFNPLEKEEISPPKDLSSQAIGGLGIHFIKKLVDSISYSYDDDTNVLILSKRIK